MKIWLKALIVIIAFSVFFLGYLLFWPVSINPVAWMPPEAPSLKGVYEPNTLLASVERIGKGVGVGPEDVAIDAQGRIYAGMKDGRIIRFDSDGNRPELLADTGGHPLGLHFDSAGNLIVCDADKGLLSITMDGALSILSTKQGQRPFRLTNDVDVGADGTIYFSDTSFKFTLKDSMADLMEHRPNGRLLAYDPANKSTRLVLDEIHFANGVAVSPDQSFVLVVEMGKYRIRRYWLTGPQEGKSDIFIDNLPGFPDGISSNGKGIFWLALVSPRKPDVDAMLYKPFLRKIVMRLPKSMLPAAENYGFVLGLDKDGRVVHNLQDPSANYAQISSVEEYKGMLYFGSIIEDSIARMPIP